jgi:hypothetical protein
LKFILFSCYLLLFGPYWTQSQLKRNAFLNNDRQAVPRLPVHPHQDLLVPYIFIQNYLPFGIYYTIDQKENKPEQALQTIGRSGILCKQELNAWA